MQAGERIRWNGPLDAFLKVTRVSSQEMTEEPARAARRSVRGSRAVEGVSRGVTTAATQEASPASQQVERRLSMALWPPGPLHRTRGDTPPHAVRIRKSHIHTETVVERLTPIAPQDRERYHKSNSSRKPLFLTLEIPPGLRFSETRTTAHPQPEIRGKHPRSDPES